MGFEDNEPRIAGATMAVPLWPEKPLSSMEHGRSRNVQLESNLACSCSCSAGPGDPGDHSGNGLPRSSRPVFGGPMHVVSLGHCANVSEYEIM